MSGNQKSHWAISRQHSPSDQPGPAADTPASAPPPTTQRAEPIRPADPLSDHRRRIVGTAFSSSRIRGSNTSTRDPAGVRSYLGGPSLANAAFTVFREQPITRAISDIENPSERRSTKTIGVMGCPRSTSPIQERSESQ